MSPLASFLASTFGVAPTNPSSPSVPGGGRDAALVAATSLASSPDPKPPGTATETSVTEAEMAAYLRAGAEPGAGDDPTFFDRKAELFVRLAHQSAEPDASRARQIANGARLRAALLRSQQKLDSSGVNAS